MFDFCDRENVHFISRKAYVTDSRLVEFCRDSVFSKHAKFRRAEPDEKELILYEQIKKKCRNMEKTFEEINAEGKANGQLLKIPYAATKKMFTESKSG